uniref:Regulator of telomere elongation helicase 1 homolog n=1 Tax=Culicoides sonorensis TaxID=179676 RepID=A0A336L6I5_CULSO
MPEITLNGVVVNFPFEPYEVQKNYMSKVIEALQGSSNAVLESPTGTGKTLCLLCSSLAWLLTKKAQVQASKQNPLELIDDKNLIKPANCLNNMQDNVFAELEAATGAKGGAWGVPKIIYASRTHSQLSQAMAEMKRTSYNFMKAAVIGSRDQLCIHTDVVKELGNANKMHMCRAKILARSCGFYQRVEQKKDHPDFRDSGILDIEDLVKTGSKHKCCPYFVSKELVEKADIIFMPYNYLLDPKARKANNIELHNSIVILDEAHNVEKMCEESASVQLKSSDIALCMEEITGIMKKLDEDIKMGLTSTDFSNDQEKQNFSLEDLATLKEVLLNLEKVVDDVAVNFTEGSTFPGDHIFELFQKAGIHDDNLEIIRKLMDDLIQYVTSSTQNNGFSSRATGLSHVSDVFTIVYASKGPNFHERVKRCYKVHIAIEEQKPQRGAKNKDGWNSMAKTTPSVKSNAKVVSFWCFNPGFGMTQVLNKNVRSVILTSGTLAPLKPLISELGIPVDVRLENPHIIKKSQVYVKIVSHGPDNEPLISNYENRNNPKYVASLARTILSFCPHVPAGLLVFFPSYFILTKCQEEWTKSGLWAQIAARKPIFIEPRTKEDFNIVMNEYYAKINDPAGKGAIFMAVCRGKVSEGLDFADKNGRAVIITGLPFPPVKDARVVLKRRYLEENRTRENEILSGNEWYGLEATRAVNQAIGRVIRHKDDYGAILLCDQRFNDKRQRDQLSRWLQEHLKQSDPKANFGKIIGELSRFFKEADRTLPKPSLKPTSYNESPSKNEVLINLKSQYGMTGSSTNIKIETEGSINAIKIENANHVPSWKPADYQRANIVVNFNQSTDKKDFFAGLKSASNSIDFNDVSSYQSSTESSLVTIHKRLGSPKEDQNRKKYKIVPNNFSTHSQSTSSSQASCIIQEVKQEVIDIDSDSEYDAGPWGAVKKMINQMYTSELVKENVSALIQAKPISSSEPFPYGTPLKSYTLDEVIQKANELPEDRMVLLKQMKIQVHIEAYKLFLLALSKYREIGDLNLAFDQLTQIFNHPNLFHYLLGMKRFIKDCHKEIFEKRMTEHIVAKLKER